MFYNKRHKTLLDPLGAYCSHHAYASNIIEPIEPKKTPRKKKPTPLPSTDIILTNPTVTIQDVLSGNSIVPVDKDFNILQNRYLVSQEGLIWSLDITYLGNHAGILLIIDLGSRLIVHSKFSYEKFNISDAVIAFQEACAFKATTPRIIHTYKEFTNKHWKQTLYNMGVSCSFSTSSAHNNQVSERLNRTIKGYLRNIILDRFNIDLKKTKMSWVRVILRVNQGNPSVFSELVNECVILYNNTTHSSLNKLPPAEQDLIFTTAKKEGLISKDMQDRIVANTNTKTAIAIRKHKAQLSEQFASNTLQVRQHLDLDLPPENILLTKSDDEIKTFIATKTDQIENSIQKAAMLSTIQNASILDAVQKAQKDVTEQVTEQFKDIIEEKNKTLQELLTRIKQKQEQEDLVAIRRQKRRQVQRKPLRDYISFEEADMIFNLISQVHKDTYVLARTRVAMIILYFSGLRISNLLLAKVKHLNDLIEKGQTSIDIIKRGSQNQLIVIGPIAQQILKDNITSINIIVQDKNEDDFLFTAQGNSFKHLHRVVFTDSINKVLHLASVQLKKNILSHSFRISVITDLIEKQGIENTQDYIGHKSIITTKMYRRRKHEDAHYIQILADVQKERSLDYKKKRIGRRKVDLP